MLGTRGAVTALCTLHGRASLGHGTRDRLRQKEDNQAARLFYEASLRSQNPVTWSGTNRLARLATGLVYRRPLGRSRGGQRFAERRGFARSLARRVFRHERRP